MSTVRKRWTRDELLVALNLYHKLTFGQLHSRQPAIAALAKRMGRGANSVAMKLNNLASLDPSLKLRGIRGLQGASSLDRELWHEFHQHMEELAPASEDALRNLFGAAETDEVEVLPHQGIIVKRQEPAGPTEVVTSVKVRRGQSYFRQAVLNNFGGRCGVTGLHIRDLLVASHILPWRTHADHRLNPRNGICLSRLHDAAFDVGLITFDDDLRLRLSAELRAALPQQTVRDNFANFEGVALSIPTDALAPEISFLQVHRKEYFRK